MSRRRSFSRRRMSGSARIPGSGRGRLADEWRRVSGSVSFLKCARLLLTVGGREDPRRDRHRLQGDPARVGRSVRDGSTSHRRALLGEPRRAATGGVGTLHAPRGAGGRRGGLSVVWSRRRQRAVPSGERAAPSSATDGVHHEQADRGVGASATRRRSGRGDPGPGARAREGATVQGTVVPDPPSPNRGWVRSFAKRGTRFSRTYTRHAIVRPPSTRPTSGSRRGGGSGPAPPGAPTSGTGSRAAGSGPHPSARGPTR